MKYTLALLCMLVSAGISAAEYFVATSGNDADNELDEHDSASFVKQFYYK